MGDANNRIYIIDKGHLEGIAVISYFKYLNISHSAYDYV